MEAVVTLHPAAAGRWALCGPGHDADRPRMAWFLRAIEQTDGSWACKHGRTVFDRHDGLSEALEHLRAIAETIRPAELYVHWLDGGIHKIGPA